MSLFKSPPSKLQEGTPTTPSDSRKAGSSIEEREYLEAQQVSTRFKSPGPATKGINQAIDQGIAAAAQQIPNRGSRSRNQSQVQAGLQARLTRGSMASSSNQASEPQLMWNPDNVKDVAESVGISALNADTVRAVQQEIEYRLSQVITEAMRFMHHSRRTVLSTQDVAQALSCLNVEPLYGYESTRPLRFGEASLGPGQPLFYVEDEEIDFEKLINAPLPKVPRDVMFTAHWLAVEGVQPPIPQNPTTAETRASDLVAKGPGANPALAALAGNDNVTFKPMVKHILSKELILYFNRVVEVIIDEATDDETSVHREAALDSIRTEPGIHQLVPYFIHFINEKLTHSISVLHIPLQMMRLTQALLENKTLFLAPYATGLCPGVVTCLLGHTLGPNSSEPLIVKAQFDIRHLAASLLGKIVQKFKATTDGLQSRLLRTCHKYWLDTDKSLPQHYGAILGILLAGGPEIVEITMIGSIKQYEYNLTRALKWAAEGRDTAVNEFNVELVVNALVTNIVSLREGTLRDKKTPCDNADYVDETPALEDGLGKLVGSKVAALKDAALNKVILEAIKKDRQHEERWTRELAQEQSNVQE